MNEKLFLAIAMISVLVPTLSVSSKAQIAQTTGTIHIRADGSIDPPTAPISTVDNVTYIFTDSINASIVVERDNIVIDGAGNTVQGTKTWSIFDGQVYSAGIDLSGRTNVTVKNTQIKNFDLGMWLDSSSNNSIIGNTVTNNSEGIDLTYSSYNILSGNNVTANTEDGISLDSSSNFNIISGNLITNDDGGILLHSFPNDDSPSNHDIISGNLIANNIYGIFLDSSSNDSIVGNVFNDDGLLVLDSYENFVENNTVNGKPLIYLEGVADFSVGDAGQVILVSCDNIRVENLNLSRTTSAIELWETNDTIVSWNNIANNSDGIFLDHSNYNVVSGNNITANDFEGVLLSSSFNNSVSGNIITGNGYAGIWLASSLNNSISGNTIVADGNYGFELESSTYNSIRGNNIVDNYEGVWLYTSSHNIINENNITASRSTGISFDPVGYSNSIYHNNFINNPTQAFEYYTRSESMNVWDDGYPDGGNYWSNYNGSDVYNGFYQNESGFDWIGDSPYVIDQNNVDRYPLMNPYSSETGEIELAYRSLLVKSHQLETSLNANISDLEGQVNILNSTANYLKTEVDNLTLTLNQTNSSFQGQIGSLGDTITGLQTQINSLNSTLQTSTNSTQKQYNSLNSQLDTISKIMYVLAAMTAVLIVTAVYVAMRKPKQKKFQQS